jgi:prepilin-type processing-associated H-X9-DG protein
LLVVIVIIAILAAMFLPVLTRAKQAAHLAKCMSNLRQIELANTLYITDHAAYPFYWTRHGDSYYNHGSWSDLLAGYLNNPSSNGVCRCPGAPRTFAGTKEEDITWANRGVLLGFPSTSSSYGVNAQGTDWFTPRGICGLFPEPDSPLPDVIPPLKETDIQAAGDMIAFGDVFLIPEGRGLEHPWVWNGMWTGGFNFMESFESFWSPGRRMAGMRMEAQRHRGLFNAAFCDGHVEALRPTELFGVVKSNLTKRWNRDHEPHTDAW